MDEIIKKAYLSRLEDCLPVDFSDGVKFGVGLCKDKKYTEEDVINIVNKSRETGLTAEYLILQLNKQD